MLLAIGSISRKQSEATAKPAEACNWLMDYFASKTLAIIRYTASSMVLYIHSNASFLSISRARSRAAGHFFLSDNPTDPNTPPIEIPPFNSPVYTSCKILDTVVGSVAEAEIGATYHDAQEACPIVTTLE